MYSVNMRVVCLIKAHHIEAESEEDLKKVVANKSFVELWAEIPGLESIQFENFPDIVDYELEE